jgi:hypothetical protein
MRNGGMIEAGKGNEMRLRVSGIARGYPYSQAKMRLGVSIDGQFIHVSSDDVRSRDTSSRAIPRCLNGISNAVAQQQEQRERQTT